MTSPYLRALYVPTNTLRQARPRTFGTSQERAKKQLDPAGKKIFDDAILLLQYATDKGHAHAAGLIGTIFFFGNGGVKIDYKRAFRGYLVGICIVHTSAPSLILVVLYSVTNT